MQCLCSLCSTFSLLQTSTCSIIPADLSAEGKSDAFAGIDLIGFSKNCKGINVNASILHDRGGILE